VVQVGDTSFLITRCCPWQDYRYCPHYNVLVYVLPFWSIGSYFARWTYYLVWQEVLGVESGSRTSSKSKTGLAAAATDSAGCHRDCILGLASAQTNQRLLISSSRDGAVKVWK
jgi:hypothetical protein